MQAKPPRVGSKGEEAFALHCRVEKLNPEREFRFYPERKWRFDFCFPAQLIGIEIEGGTWTGGRHNRGAGFEKDAEKYNQAAKMGYRILRYSTQMVLNGDAINDILELLRPA